MAQAAPQLTYQQWLHKMRDAFGQAGLPSAALDARVLVSAISAMTQTQLALKGDIMVPDEQAAQLDIWQYQHIAGVPVSRLIGSREFYGLDFKINSQVLDPRADSESLVDAVLARHKNQTPNVLDLGTGSGCLLLSVLANLPGASGVGVDLSPGALRTARLNAHRLGLRDRVGFRHSRWFQSLHQGDGLFDVIVSNPPYIPSAVIGGLEVNVRDHDPILALDGGPDGLRDYRHISRHASAYLRDGGWLYFEIGHDQAMAVEGLLKQTGFDCIRVTPDLAGRDRLVCGQKKLR